jgi:hypothetical protein
LTSQALERVGLFGERLMELLQVKKPKRRSVHELGVSRRQRSDHLRTHATLTYIFSSSVMLLALFFLALRRRSLKSSINASGYNANSRQ